LKRTSSRHSANRFGLAFLAAALVWTVAADRGLAQRPPPGSPGGDFAGIETRTPAISGTVVDAVTGAPIAGAAVALGPASLTGSHQQTDDAGRFLFSNLSARTAYELTATKPGCFDGAFGRETWDGPPRRIILSETQWVSDARIRLFRPSAISGRVLDGAGEPMAGVRVVSLRQIVVAGVLRLASGPATRTDDRGIYRIAPLPPGAYVVVVPPAPTTGASESRDAGQSPPLPRAVRRTEVYPVIFYPAARTAEAARVITLGPSEERTGTDITLRPAPAFNVSGRIDGPLRDMRMLALRLVPHGSDVVGPGLDAATATVGDDGRFAFAHVPDGSYTIVASPSEGGYVLVPPGAPEPSVPALAASTSRTLVATAPTATWLAVTSRSATPYWIRAPLTVAGRDVTDLVVPAQRGATIRGRVVAEDSVGVRSMAPVVMMTEGLAVRGSRTADDAIARLQETIARRVSLDVIAEPADGDPRLGLARTKVSGTDSLADFAIDGLLPGEYLLRTPSAGVKSVRWNGRDYTDTPLPVSAGQDVTGVEIVIDRIPPTTGGTVRDAQYRDVLDATVLTFPVDRSRWRRTGLDPIAMKSTPVGRGGAYRFLALPAGEYYFVAIAGQLTSNWQDHAFLERAAGVATRATLEWGQVRLPDLVVVELAR
jgi:hypothetical protein